MRESFVSLAVYYDVIWNLYLPTFWISIILIIKKIIFCLSTLSFFICSLEKLFLFMHVNFIIADGQTKDQSILFV